MTNLQTLFRLLAEEIKELHHAETQLLKALPRMCHACASEELADAFAEHYEETRTHVDRLEEICRTLRINPGGRQCKAMAGLLDEIHGLITSKGDGTVRDLGLIAAAKRVEIYEIRAYGSANALAERLGLDEVADVLAGSTDDEVAVDRILTRIAASLCQESVALAAS